MGLRLIPRRFQPFNEQLSRRVLLNVMIESNTEKAIKRFYSIIKDI